MNDYKIKELMEEMELELISSMKRNLSRHLKEEDKVGFEFTQWQAEKLKELKRYQRQNKDIIDGYTKGLDKKISEHLKKELNQGAINSIKEHNKLFNTNIKTSKLLNKSFFKTNDKKVNTLIKVVNKDLKTANTSALRMINDEYRRIIHKSVFFLSNGTVSPKKAIDMATKDFLSRGLNCIEYKDGKRVNIASYSEMAVRTASLRTQLMADGDFRKSIGRHLVIALASNAACPLCSKWENKVMIDDVYSGGTKEDGNYPLLSYAMKSGFLHPNCRDGIATYYPEIEDIEKSYEDGNASEETYQNDLNYINQRIKQFTRLETGSLDEENIKKYHNQRVAYEKKKDMLAIKGNYTSLTNDEIKVLQKSSDECYNSLTANEKDAMYDYCMGGYQDINDYLNGKFEGYSNLDKAVTVIDNAMAKYELQQDVITYRKTDIQFYDKYKIGDIFQEKMYYSTSLSKNIAENVSDYHNNPIIVEIRVPKGTKSIYVGDNTDYDFEAELLLSRNLSYKVIEKTKDNVVLEVINEKRK